jgi:hypothetical protein
MRYVGRLSRQFRVLAHPLHPRTRIFDLEVCKMWTIACEVGQHQQWHKSSSTLELRTVQAYLNPNLAQGKRINEAIIGSIGSICDLSIVDKMQLKFSLS